MAFDLSAASNVLKVRYLGPIREQLNGATILLSRIGRNDMNVSGKTFTIPLHSTRNTAAGVGVADGGTLPTAGQQGYDTAIVPNAYLYSRIKVTGPTIRAARDDAGAFVRAVDSEVNGVTRDMKRAVNRQLHSDGIDALAYKTDGTNTSPFTVDDNRGNGFTHLPNTGSLAVDIYGVSGGVWTKRNTGSAGVNITAVAAPTGTPQSETVSLTATIGGSFDTLAGTADGDALILLGSAQNQMMGIAGIISASDPAAVSGGLQGLAVATKGYWKAQVVSGDTAGTNQALTLARMQKPLDLIATNSDFDETDVKFLLCSYGVRAKYIDLLVSEKRFVNTMTLDGGFKGVDFNGIPLVPDPQCRKNRIYYVSPESMKILRTSDFDWMDKDGSMLFRISGQDAYEAVLFHYGNLAVFARNANGLLDDITE